MHALNPLIFLIALALGGSGAGIIGSYGQRFGLIDRPNERSSHHRPTPKGGGIGILAAFLSASLFFEIPLLFWSPTAVLALFSFFGDKLELSPKFRLVFQFTAAIILLAGTGQFDITQFYGFLLMLSMVVFAVGTANIYNFMDGIDGIAAITGIVGFGLLTFSFFHAEDGRLLGMLCLCISISSLGFLPFNIPKAKVFMGDVGSILLGFVFAGLVIVLSKSLLDFVCLTGFLFPFYADELTTTGVRLKDGENLLRAHRRHVYQLLANEKRIAHWKVSVGYGILQLVVGLSLLLLKPLGIVVIMALLGIYFTLFILISAIIRRSLGATT